MSYRIVTASEAMIAEVEAWLDDEEAAYETAHAEWMKTFEGDVPARGFRCNWDLVKADWAKDHSKVDVLIMDGKAIGFLWGTNILEIHPNYRGRGLGVIMSDHMLKQVREQDRCVLEIEIAPSSAEPFWLGQGFELLDNNIHHNDPRNHAFIKLGRSFDLGSGPRVPVEIEFYDEGARYNNQEPFEVWAGEGERLPDGSIQLPERVIGYTPLIRYNTDNHIRIVVDGKELYFERSKYGQGHGAARDANGNHYIDRIVP